MITTVCVAKQKTVSGGKVIKVSKNRFASIHLKFYVNILTRSGNQWALILKTGKKQSSEMLTKVGGVSREAKLVMERRTGQCRGTEWIRK